MWCRPIFPHPSLNCACRLWKIAGKWAKDTVCSTSTGQTGEWGFWKLKSLFTSAGRVAHHLHNFALLFAWWIAAPSRTGDDGLVVKGGCCCCQDALLGRRNVTTPRAQTKTDDNFIYHKLWAFDNTTADSFPGERKREMEREKQIFLKDNI